MAIIAPIVSTFDNRGIRRAESGFSDFSRKVGRSLANVAKAGAAIGVAVGAASFKAIQSASDLAEATSATEQIFGDAAEAVLRFADGAAEAFGQSKQSALEGAQVFGTFGKAAGLAGADLSDFTTGLLELSSDIASFRNASPEEVIEAIGAGLRGESEPLRRFGVLLDDATLKAEAMALGIYSGNKPLTQQQKILAAEAAIYKQTGDAQGDFARTSDGLANSTRILQARMSNIVATLGERLLPVALTVSSFFLEKVIPTIESLATTFSEEGLLGVLNKVWEWMKENAPKLGEKFLELGAGLYGWIKTNAPKAIERLGTWLDSIGTWITQTGYPYVKEHFGEWTQTTWDWITEDALPVLSGWLESVTNWIDESYTKIDGAFKDLRSTLWNWITGTEVDEQTQSAIGTFVSRLGSFLLAAIKTSVKLTQDLAITFGVVIAAALGRGLVEAGIISQEQLEKIPAAWAEATEVISGWYETGKQLASLMIDGIVDFLTDNTVVQRVTDAILGVLNPVAGFLGDVYGEIFEVATSPIRTAIGAIQGDAATPTTTDVPTRFDPRNFGVTYNLTVNGALDPVSVGNQIVDIINTNNNRLGYPTGVLT
jgi:hypothetical protein